MFHSLIRARPEHVLSPLALAPALAPVPAPAVAPALAPVLAPVPSVPQSRVEDRS